MSPRRYRLVILPEARRDISDILLLTRKRWGSEQRTAYKREIDQALSRLKAYPFVGQSRDDYFVGCRTMLVGQHVVYHQVMDGTVEVLRVLHQREQVFDG